MFRSGAELRKTENRVNVRRVSEKELRQLQLALAEMAKDVLDLCKREGLEVMLSGGSCLGAVRHKGIIPWDDDIDLNMPRVSFERLCDVFDANLGDRYELLVPGRTPGYRWRIPQIRKKGTHIGDLASVGVENDGIFLDIFIIESVPDAKILRCVQGVLSLGLTYLASCRATYESRDVYRRFFVEGSSAQRGIERKIKIGFLTRLVSLSLMLSALDRVNGLFRNGESRLVSLPSGSKFYFGETVPREWMLPTSEGKFEGTVWPVPCRVDKYLTNLYGPDYMTPPPRKNRETHAFAKFDLGEV